MPTDERQQKKEKKKNLCKHVMPDDKKGSPWQRPKTVRPCICRRHMSHRTLQGRETQIQKKNMSAEVPGQWDVKRSSSEGTKEVIGSREREGPMRRQKQEMQKGKVTKRNWTMEKKNGSPHGDPSMLSVFVRRQVAGFEGDWQATVHFNRFRSEQARWRPSDRPLF